MKTGVFCLNQAGFRLLTALSFCGVSPASAEQSFNFNNCLGPPGTVLNGAARIANDGTGLNCVLHLTDTNQCGTNGTFVISDQAAGANLDHLHVRWRSLVGGDLGQVCGVTQFDRPGADGYSFNWGTNLAASGIGEEGTGTGLTVTVDTFDNGGGEAPALEIKWRGDRVAFDSISPDPGVAKDFLRKNEFVEASLDVDSNGLATFAYDGRILSATLSGWTGIVGGNFAFGARTGGAADNHWIDDLVIGKEAVPTALSFDGVDDVMYIGYPPQPAPWTVELWVKRQDSTDASAILLGDTNTALKLEQFLSTRRLGFTAFGSGDYTFNYTAPANAWVHLAFVAGTNTQLYVNGLLQDTHPAVVPLGWRQLGGDIENRYINHVRGTIDEVRVWSYARSEAEIRATLDRPLSGSEANLLAYWRFNDGEGVFASDSSTHDRNGILLNGPTWVDSNVSFPILINEWLAQNVGNLADDFGERDPWLELYNAGDCAVELGGFFLTDDLNDKTKYLIPANTVLQPTGHLLVWADGQPGQSAPSKPHANFRLAVGVGAIALFSSGGALIDSVTFGRQRSDLSQGRCPDGSVVIHTMSAPTPGSANVSGDPSLLVMTGPWKYNASGTDLGTAWLNPAYDDSSWAAGPALLYNETSALPAPKNTPLPLGPITYYFRAHFSSLCPFAPNTLFASLIVDDGAVVYLNGVEVLRLGMAAGAINSTTLSGRAVDNAVLEGPFSIPVGSLVPGDNLLAVEVHQRAADSSDIVFGLTLGSTNRLPLAITQSPLSQTVRAAAHASFTIAAGGSPPLSYQWRKDGTNLPGATGSAILLSNVQPADAGAYSVFVSDAFTSLISAAAMLTVDSTPLITVQPESQFVSFNATVTFTVAANPPPLAYQWRRNGFRIPGATNTSHTITNVSPTDGGTYAVSVGNAGGKVLSDPVTLVVDAPAGLGGDSFLGAADFSSPLVNGNNADATSQPGEPHHAGKLGGKSVWYVWQPVSSGIATIHTRGSTFDTLLGVYTGGSVNDLTRIAGDEDRGGFHTSEVRFNAVPGTLYRIAVDGFAGAEGTYVLSREFEETFQTLPVITSQPASRVVQPGSNATFTVSATGTGLGYQWAFLGTPIAGATAATLLVTNALPGNVGYYTARVRNLFGRMVESLPAYLELRSVPGMQCAEKFEDLFPPPSGGGGGGAGIMVGANGAIPQFVVPASPSLTTGQVVFDHLTTRGAGPGRQVCGIPDNTMWHTLPLAAQDAILCIEAFGAATKPRVAAAIGVPIGGLLVPSPIPNACDRTDLAMSEPGRVAFSVTAGTQYYYEVDTPTGDQVNVTIRLGAKLSISPLPSSPGIVRMTWCAPTNYYMLEWTDRLRWPPQTSVWSALPSSALGNGVRVDRFAHTVDLPINPLTSPARFFRLHKGP